MNIFLLSLLLAALPPAQIHATGPLHGDQATARDGERWLALIIDGPLARLEPVVISVEAIEDPFVDAEGERTGREVGVPGMSITPPLLLAGGELQPGAVDVASMDRELSFLLGEDGLWLAPLSLQLPGDYPVELVLDCSAGDSDAGVDGTCTLWLQRGERRQPLMQYAVSEGDFGLPVLGDDAPLYLLFAGDLDGDGQLDLILDLGDHYNVSTRTLLLSGAARDGELVREVARHQTTGC